SESLNWLSERAAVGPDGSPIIGPLEAERPRAPRILGDGDMARPCTVRGDKFMSMVLAVTGGELRGDRVGAGDRPRASEGAGEFVRDKEPFQALGLDGRPNGAASASSSATSSSSSVRRPARI